MCGRPTVQCGLKGTQASVAVEFSEHAVHRFIERARPSCDLQTAADEIQRLADFASVSPDRPGWERNGRRALMYLTCGDIAFVLDPARADSERLMATTCLVRGMTPRGDRGREGKACARASTQGRRATPYRRPSPGSLTPEVVDGALSC